MSLKSSNDSNSAILIAYGSNLPSVTMIAESWSASQAFAQVVKTLQERGLIVNKISRLWRSMAWPDASQPPYVNAVMSVDTRLEPQALLHLLHDVEVTAGRVRNVRNAPRILDLDIIAYGRIVLHDGGVILPHPRAHERAFVMGPIVDIFPDWLHPVLGETASTIWKSAEIGKDAYPLSEEA